MLIKKISKETLCGVQFATHQRTSNFIEVLDVLSDDDHAHFNGIFELLHDATDIFVVTEYAEQGDLNKYIFETVLGTNDRKGKLDESAVRGIAK